MNSLEYTIIKNLVCNDEYRRQVFPYLKVSYFESDTNLTLFKLIKSFIEKYEKCPTKESLEVDLQGASHLSEETFKNVSSAIRNLEKDDSDYKWLVDTTEEWCRNRAIYLSLLESIKIAEGDDKEKDMGSIPTILSDAISVSFDNKIGHDYLDDYQERFDFYNRVETKIPFDLAMFNKITKGGLTNKSLNVALAGTGVGKSLFMCHVAASTLLQGKNVLYITCEMSEEKIAERIDANLLSVPIQDIASLPRKMYESKVNNLMKKTSGKLIIKEYPTASAHVGHFRSLLSDLSLKKSFKPDIIFVDYLNICTSQRFKASFVNSYTLVKGIAEELRGLAVEQGVPVVSATQTTRSGYGSTDIDLTDTSESFGLPATADLMFALISTEESEQLGQILVKQLKNRYNDLTINKRFAVGIDRAKMKLYDCEQSAQDGMIDAGDDNEKPSTNKTKFGGFNFD
jgi:archaellum biogenesis ATPase FlaH|tara:strand:+ start:512 stop:1879 length:1368 start_codon:yes stop_codon:yes gene_type:complete